MSKIETIKAEIEIIKAEIEAIEAEIETIKDECKIVEDDLEKAKKAKNVDLIIAYENRITTLENRITTLINEIVELRKEIFELRKEKNRLEDRKAHTKSVMFENEFELADDCSTSTNINSSASTTAKTDSLCHLIPPIVTYFGPNKLIQKIQDISKQQLSMNDDDDLSHFLLESVPFAPISYRIKGQAETDYSRPTLDNILAIVVNRTNNLLEKTNIHAPPVSLKSESLRPHIGERYHFASVSTLPETVISLPGSGPCLLSSEAKGVDASIYKAYCQAVQISSDCCCYLEELSFPLDNCVVPFICLSGWIIQFGITLLIPNTFPNSYALSSHLDLLNISDRVQIAQWINAFSVFLVDQTVYYSQRNHKDTLDILPRGKLERYNFFYKPIYTKLLHLTNFTPEQMESKLLFQFSYQMEIFRRLWQGECKNSISFPIGFVGYPDISTQKKFAKFIENQVYLSYKEFKDIPFQAYPGYPILIFDKITQDRKWKTMSEIDDKYDDQVLNHKDSFIRDLQNVFTQVYAAGVIHLDIRLENIFYFYDHHLECFEFLIIDWSDALLRDYPIPYEHYVAIQDNNIKYPSNLSMATNDYHTHSINRIEVLINAKNEWKKIVTLKENRAKTRSQTLQEVEELTKDVQSKLKFPEKKMPRKKK